MKRYVLQVSITEGNDEFWENLVNKSGCDEIEACVRQALSDAGWHDPEQCQVRLTCFADDGEE